MDMTNVKYLDQAEADQLLAMFLEDGAANISTVMEHASLAGVNCDYSIDSLSPFLHWACSEMRIVPKQPDLTLPHWIRETDDYKTGLFEFEDRSKNLICFAAFYFGDCFVRTFPSLSWGTGHRESTIANWPVVKGFQQDQELAPMWVIQNVFRRMIRKPTRAGDIDAMIKSWRESVA